MSATDVAPAAAAEPEPAAALPRRPPVPCMRCGLPTTSDVGVMLYSPLCVDCQYDFLADMEHDRDDAA